MFVVLICIPSNRSQKTVPILSARTKSPAYRDNNVWSGRKNASSDTENSYFIQRTQQKRVVFKFLFLVIRETLKFNGTCQVFLFGEQTVARLPVFEWC